MNQDHIAFVLGSARFTLGYWTLDKPKVPGSYPIAARNTPTVGTAQIMVVYEDPRSGEVKPVNPWGGWWWSEPLPPFPRTPDESEDSE